MRQPIRSSIARATLALAILATTGAAKADWQVIDNTAIDKLTEILTSIGRRSGGGGDSSSLNDTASNLLKEIQTQVRRATFSAALSSSNLQKIADTSGYVRTACGAGPAGAGQIVKLAAINPVNPAAARQEICQQLIQLRAQSFNDGVDMVALWASSAISVLLPDGAGLTGQALQQGGIGMLMTVLLITAPPMAGSFFGGTVGSFTPYSAIGGANHPGPQGQPPGSYRQQAASQPSSSEPSSGNTDTRIGAHIPNPRSSFQDLPVRNASTVSNNQGG